MLKNKIQELKHFIQSYDRENKLIEKDMVTYFIDDIFPTAHNILSQWNKNADQILMEYNIPVDSICIKINKEDIDTKGIYIYGYTTGIHNTDDTPGPRTKHYAVRIDLLDVVNVECPDLNLATIYKVIDQN